MNIHFKLFISLCISLIFCTESIVINEINYNSQEAIFNPEDWVEFYNTTSSPINMYNWKFYDENESHVYTFDESVVIDANGYIVLCKNIELFTSLFPNVSNCFGDIGFGFAGGGESLRLVDYNGSLIDSVHYDDNEPWPIEADGEGSTLELINPYYDNLIPSSWGPSNDFGTPGSQNSNYIPINQDCNGEWGGNAILDQCGACVSPDNTSSCIQGCDGNYANDGTHLADDECGVCGGDNSTCSDCTGTPNGTSIIDECGACVSSDDTSCTQGCDGNYANDGTHLKEDVCGVCNGGINDVSSCVDCPESDLVDCLGVCGGSAVNDECGVCSGDNSTCSDCTGAPNGTSIINECGACVSSGDTSCIQGCDGNYDNDGTHLIDDECGVCGGDGSSCLSIVDNILSEFSIDRVYPNPFNPVVNIDYSLSTSSFINILIYDLNGQIVNNLFSGYKSIGSHSIIWDAARMSSGVYVILIKSNKKSLDKRLILSK